MVIAEEEVPEDVPNPVAEAVGGSDGQGEGLGGEGGEATDIEAQATPGSTEGRARDPLTGKFVPKAGAEGSETPLSPAEAEAPGEGAAAGVATEVAPAPALTSRPYAVKATGRSHEVPGVSLRADGTLEATLEGVELISTYMGRGIKYETEMPRLKAELQHLREGRSEQEEWNQQVGEQYAALAQLPDEELVAAIQDFRAQYPSLRERVRADRAERELQAMRRGSAPDQTQQRQQREQQFYSTFDAVWADEIAKANGVLTLDEQKELQQELRGISDSLLIIADRDDEDEGIRKGDWLFNDQRMASLIATRVATVKRYKTQQSVDARAKAANAAVLTPAKPKAPPLAANASPAAVGAAGDRKFKDKDEWKRSMYSAS